MKNNYIKKFALTFGIAMLSLGIYSQQQITNSDFENWDELGSANERPVNWNNIKNGDLCFFCGFGAIQTSFRDTDVRPGSTGTYSAKLKSGSAAGNIINGAITLGRLHAPNTSPSNGYNQTHRDNAQYSQVLTDKPDSVVFWAKYTITNSNDSARISAIIHDDYDLRDPANSNSLPHIVGTAIKSFQTGGNWIRISVPFEYAGPSTDAQYILVTLTSSHVPGNGVDGATVYIDDLELIYNPEIVNEVQIAPIAVQNLIENQTGTTLNATETPVAATSRQWKYATVSGGPYTNVIAGETGVNYNPQFATAGTYYVVVESDFNGDIQVSNEVQVNVTEFTSLIAPNAIQNLIENQAGTQLTVTETPNADAREWKYSTTSGSGYTSFANAETNLSYTPQFASAGTYYVVCESTIDNIDIVSNEVQINVSAFEATIAPVAIQNLIENQSGSILTVTENITADSREWKYSTTSGSGYTAFSTSEIGTTYTPLFANANTYYVVCESTYGGNTVVSNEVQINVSAFEATIAPVAIQNLIENQSGSTLTVTENISSDSREWKFSTTSGSGYTAFSTSETGTTYTPLFANANTYYVVCEATYAGNTVVSNEVQINVSEFDISIAPVNTQDLVENQSGTTLTATENISSDSREWKFSTTSGSGYTAFSTNEIGTTYTPLFANSNTYYVICEATYGGNTVISNEVQINVTPAVSNVVSISPNSTQFLIENQEGTVITANELPSAANSRQWKYGVTTGGPYSTDLVGENTLSYTPVFSSAGDYYVVIESDFGGGDVLISNEVKIVVSEFTNSIAPIASQNLFVDETGDELTVTESPNADSREWKYSTTSGSGYMSFTNVETNLNYTPQFGSVGTYYVVCESTIDGITVTSNEVVINVEEEPIVYSVIIEPAATQNLMENELGDELSAIESPSAADARQWKYATTSGGTYTDLTGETGLTYTPQFASAGTYYVIVESDFDGDMQISNEVIVNVEVEPIVYSVIIEPAATQNLMENELGDELSAIESPSAADARQWKYATTSGGTYTDLTGETGLTYTPQFASAGTYYVVVESDFDGDIQTSNEVIVNVEVEPIVYSVTIEPTETQNLIENQLGDELTAIEAPSAADARQWKYATTSGGTYTDVPGETGLTYTPVFADAGTYYVIVESNFDGDIQISNEVIVNVEEFVVTISPEEDQTIEVGDTGNELTVTESHTVDSRDWKISTTSGSGYMSFQSPESGTSVTPGGGSVGTFYVVCESTIDAISVISNEVVINVVETSGINGNELTSFKVYVSEKDLKVDFSSFEFNGGMIEVLSMDGKLIAKSKLTPNNLNTIHLPVQTGIYNYRISNGSQTFNGKVFVK